MDTGRNYQNFREQLWQEIHVRTATNGSVDREELLYYVTDLMTEAEETEDFVYVHHEGVGKRNKRIQIDGYSYSELDECLSIFIATPMLYDRDDSLTSTEANRYISMAAAFLENAELIKSEAEESSPGYGLACDVIGLYKNVLKYKIYLISDKPRSLQISRLEDLTVRGKQAECQIWDITRIFSVVNSAREREDIVIHLNEFDIPGLPCLLASETTDYQAYLCDIPGKVLADLYNKYGSRLLEGNVRSFLQVRGKVNKGIRVTILNEPDMFFAYNNGIAATASAVKINRMGGSSYITEITALQIVNGGQTTASLATALIKDKKDNSEETIKRIHVPMKLSIVQPEKADRLIANIARYANSQNKVSDADLWSNHPFQIRMEEYSRRIIAPATQGKQYGTYWYYERANGQYNQETYKATPKQKLQFVEQHPKNQRITKTDLAKYMLVFEKKPAIAGKGGQKAFMEFASEISKAWEKDSTQFNDDYFRNAVSIAILFRETDSIVRKQTWYSSYKANIVEYTIALLFHAVEEQKPDLAINLKSIWQKQSLSLAWQKQIKETSYLVYRFLISEKRDIENVTEWAKREKCWQGAKNLQVILLPEFVGELQSKFDVQAENKNARAQQKLSDELNPMITVVNYGVEGWEKLRQWNRDHRVLSPAEMHLIDLAVRMDGGLISFEWQCSKVLKTLEKCRREGFPG